MIELEPLNTWLSVQPPDFFVLLSFIFLWDHFFLYLKNTLKISFCVCLLLTNSVSDHMKMSLFYPLSFRIFSMSMEFCVGKSFFSAQRTHSTAFFLPLWSTSQVVPVWGNIPHVFKTNVLWMVYSPL